MKTVSTVHVQPSQCDKMASVAVMSRQWCLVYTPNSEFLTAIKGASKNYQTIIILSIYQVAWEACAKQINMINKNEMKWTYRTQCVHEFIFMAVRALSYAAETHSCIVSGIEWVRGRDRENEKENIWWPVKYCFSLFGLVVFFILLCSISFQCSHLSLSFLCAFYNWRRHTEGERKHHHHFVCSLATQKNKKKI